MLPQGVSEELDKVANKYQQRKKKKWEKQKVKQAILALIIYLFMTIPNLLFQKECKATLKKKKIQQHKTKNKWTKINDHHIIHCYEL